MNKNKSKLKLKKNKNIKSISLSELSIQDKIIQNISTLKENNKNNNDNIIILSDKIDKIKEIMNDFKDELEINESDNDNYEIDKNQLYQFVKIPSNNNNNQKKEINPQDIISKIINIIPKTVNSQEVNEIMVLLGELRLYIANNNPIINNFNSPGLNNTIKQRDLIETTISTINAETPNKVVSSLCEDFDSQSTTSYTTSDYDDYYKDSDIISTIKDYLPNDLDISFVVPSQDDKTVYKGSNLVENYELFTININEPVKENKNLSIIYYPNIIIQDSIKSPSLSLVYDGKTTNEIIKENQYLTHTVNQTTSCIISIDKILKSDDSDSDSITSGNSSPKISDMLNDTPTFDISTNDIKMSICSFGLTSLEYKSVKLNRNYNEYENSNINVRSPINSPRRKHLSEKNISGRKITESLINARSPGISSKSKHFSEKLLPLRQNNNENIVIDKVKKTIKPVKANKDLNIDTNIQNNKKRECLTPINNNEQILSYNMINENITE